jgi:hypothetical protein
VLEAIGRRRRCSSSGARGRGGGIVEGVCEIGGGELRVAGLLLVHTPHSAHPHWARAGALQRNVMSGTRCPTIDASFTWVVPPTTRKQLTDGCRPHVRVAYVSFRIRKEHTHICCLPKCKATDERRPCAQIYVIMSTAESMPNST